MRTYPGRFSHRSQPTLDEIEKYRKHADDLETKQRQRFEKHPDRYTFFNSMFEQTVKEDIDDFRTRVENMQNDLKSLEHEKLHRECQCNDPDCPYQQN